MEPSSQEGASDLFAMLEGTGGPKVKQLIQDTDKAIGNITSAAGISLSDSAQDVASKIATWAERLAAEGAKSGVNLEELRARMSKELSTVNNDQAIDAQRMFTEDLRKAVFGLTAEQQQFEQFLGQLDGECPEADAEIKRADDRVENARNAVPRREMELQMAQQRRTFMGLDWGGAKKAAVAKATTNLEEAKVELETAKADVPEAKIRAEELRRDRLMKARPEELLNLILAKGMKVYETGMARAQILKKEEELAAKERVQVVKDREVAQRTLDKLNSELAEKELALANLTEQIERTADPSERAGLETILSNQKAELDKAVNNRNTAFLYSQSKQRMAELLQETEEAARSLRGSIEGMCIMLKSDLETRETVYRAGVEALKGAADMKVLSSADQAGARTDQRMLETMAQTALAAQRTVAETMAAHPNRLAAMRTVRRTMAAQKAEVDDKIAVELAEFFRNYDMVPDSVNSGTYRKVPTVAEAAGQG